jgi:hypothetical protein
VGHHCIGDRVAKGDTLQRKWRQILPPAAGNVHKYTDLNVEFHGRQKGTPQTVAKLTEKESTPSPTCNATASTAAPPSSSSRTKRPKFAAKTYSQDKRRGQRHCSSTKTQILFASADQRLICAIKELDWRLWRCWPWLGMCW